MKFNQHHSTIFTNYGSRFCRLNQLPNILFCWLAGIAFCLSAVFSANANDTRKIGAETGSQTDGSAKLVAPYGEANDQFGSSVAISGDTAVVGTYGGNSIYVYARMAGTWTLQQKILPGEGEPDDRFGSSVSISGNTIVVGSPDHTSASNGFNQGAAYVFIRSGSVWSLQKKLVAADGQQNDYLGTSVSIVGNTIVVGAPGVDAGGVAGRGAAYIFERLGDSWIRTGKFMADDAAADDFLGTGVSTNGTYIVVGAYGDNIGANTDQGSAYIFARTFQGWAQTAKLAAADGSAGDQFGKQVAISGETVVAGAHLFDVVPQFSCSAAYVFVKNGAAWTQQARLLASDGAGDDAFGKSVSISGNTILIGMPNDDSQITNHDSAYIFLPAAARRGRKSKNSPRTMRAKTIFLPRASPLTMEI